MKKLAFGMLAVLALGQAAHAETAYSIGAAKHMTKADVDLTGVELGMTTTPNQTGWYGAANYMGHDNQDNLKVKSYGVNGGYQHSFYHDMNMNVLGKIGLGYDRLEVEGNGMSDDYNVFSIPVAVEANYNLMPNTALFGQVGYKFAHAGSNDIQCGNVSVGDCNTANELVDKSGFSGATLALGLRQTF